MAEIIKHRELVESVTYLLTYCWRDNPNGGFSFPCKEDGTVIEVKGNEEIEYDGEIHTAANLYDALKEGYYGKF